jgi:carbohydrate-selective porin OprB
MIVKRQFLVTLTIDTEKAKGWKNGEYDWDTYPNWDLNYGSNDERGPLDFIKSMWAEFKQYWRYKGLKCEIKKLEDGIPKEKT